MAYSADTFVADEQPTTAKWNKLWTNDASFNDGTGIATGAITSAKISGLDRSLLTTDSNPYRFRARRTSALTLGSSSFQKITFNTEDYDTNANYDNATNYRYTAPVTGYYAFTGSSEVTVGSTNIVTLYKNGTEIVRGVRGTGAGIQRSIVSSGEVATTAADYFEIFTFYDGTGAIDVSSAAVQPHFSGAFVSKT